MRISRSRRLVQATGAAVLVSVALLGARAATASSSTCFGDPYSYTQQQLHACGVRTFPLLSKIENADGSTTYTYNVEGDATTYRIPPPNFDFTTATPAQLNEYNIPPGTQLSNLHIVTPPPFLAASGMSGGSLGLSALVSGSPQRANHHESSGTPVINLGTVTPRNDNGGVGTFGGTPLPGPRTPSTLPFP